MKPFSAVLWSIFFPDSPTVNRKSLSSPAAIPFGNAESVPLATSASALGELLPPSNSNSALPAGKCVAQQFCVYGQVDAAGDTVDFTIHSTAKGWVALGITTTGSMMDATMIVGWKNSSQDGLGYTVSDRYSNDHIMPAPESGDGKSSVLPLLVPLPDWATIGFSFKRPVKVGRAGRDASVVLGKDTAFIYAFSNKPPVGNVDDSNAKFRIHGLSDCGSLGVIDFISPPPPPTSTASSTSTSSAPSPTPTLGSSSICAPEANTFCLYGEPDDASENIIFTIHSKAAGWAAMGTGDDMSSSSITVGWLNSTGGITLSDRFSKEEAMPLPAPAPTSLLLSSLRVPKPEWASLAFSFSRPIKGNVVFSSSMHYIYAFAAKPPRFIDSPSSLFSRHDKYGSFGVVNFLEKGGGPKPPPSSSSTSPSPSPSPNPGGGSGDTTSECIPGVFCVYGEPDGKGNVLITLHAAAKGWVGLGVGSSMMNAAMIVGWKNSAGTYIVSDRTSTSNSLPGLAPSLSKLVALKHPSPSWANIAFTVSRPFQASAGAISGSSAYIYAFADKSPASPDSASSSFSKHSSAGSLGVLDFTTAKGSGKAPSPLQPEGKGGIVAQSQNGIGSSCINSLYCVYSEPDGNGNVYITLMSASGGWVGLGTGTSMDDSFMIVGWKNSSGGYTVSERTSKGTIMPSVASTDSAGSSQVVVALRVEKPSWASLAFTILRPLKSNAITYTPTTSFIYAYSGSTPSSIDSPSSNFAVHNGRGQLGVLDFTTIHKVVGSGGANDTIDPSPADKVPRGGEGVLGSTCIPNQFCVYSEPDEKGNVYITLQSSMSGWVALGTGDAMAGSFMIVGWKNSSGGFTVSDRVATGEAMPDIAPTQASVLVPPRVPAPSWAQISFTVLRPLKTSEITYTPSTRFIYGISSKSSSSVDDSKASFQIHDRYGKLGNLDFTTMHTGVGTSGGDDSAPILQLPEGVEYITVIRIHGYVMIYAWIVCPLVAIFIARYLKSRLGHLWFELHRAIMIIGCFFGTIGGTLIIYLFKSGPHFSTANSLHPLLGLLIGIILVIQIGLGIASHKLFSPDRPSVPWWDKAHWWVGRIVCFCAAANIVTGIVYADHFQASALALPVLFGLILTGGVAAFVLGERYFGQVHHVKLLQDPGESGQQPLAKQILEQFQAHPKAWEKVDQILEQSELVESRFIALQILETLIKTMWKVLPATNRQGIKNFIIAFIIKTASDEASLTRNRTLLGKLNIVLVQILKQDWPHNWPSFIPEIVQSSKTNLSLCENNMVILKLLSEEIFDFSAEQMTQSKTKSLKNTLCGEFSEIFQLCHEVLEQADKASLVSATLNTLLRFLNWIPLGYIFETNLIALLCNRFFVVPAFRNVVLKCLTEIGSLQVGPEYNDQFVLFYQMVVQGIQQIMPLNTNLADIYENSSDDDQNFIQNLGIFLSSFFSAHLKPVETTAATQPPIADALLTGHRYLIKVSEVKDREVFKVCLEYWAKLVAELYDDASSAPRLDPVLNLGFGSRPAPQLRRAQIYTDILSSLRVVMIEAMVRPEEVLIVENDEGEIVRETLKESDTIILYKSMREVLVYLTHLDTEDIERIMSAKLEKQMDGTEWSWDNLNKLCWAVGSISGALSEETEKRFLVMVIKELLTLCEAKRGKDNKAVVASNIMYVVGQYPRFLKNHWKFLKTVVNKLFEFMHELHEGVQDMACDTFIKIAQKCRRHFVIQQPQEIMPYIEEILSNIDTITSDLQPQQVHTFYEAVGCMIAAQPNKTLQERLIVKYMELPNRAWDNYITQAGQNVELLNQPETVKIFANILKTNVAGCVSVGSPFGSQIGRIFLDLLGLYKAVGGLISEAVVTQGLIAAKTPRVRGLRTIKKEILKLMDSYIQKAEDLPALNTHMIPSLLEAVLLDYQRNVEPAKESEVLNVMSNIITRLGTLISDKIAPILDAVFECTLNMINKNFEEYPEHRIGFFKLLQAINLHCFDAVLVLAKPQFKMLMDSIVWSFKHTMRDIGEVGLSICIDLMTNFSKCDPQVANTFFQDYYVSLLQDLFFVLTSTSHKSGFKLQSLILMNMFQLVESNSISVPLYDPSTYPSSPSNTEFLSKFISDMLASAFPHLQPIQIQQFVIGLFKFAQDPMTFKAHLRDFLVTLKEFSGADNAELYLEEREQALEEKKKTDFEAAMKIPGMIKPSQLPDENDMLD